MKMGHSSDKSLKNVLIIADMEGMMGIADKSLQNSSKEEWKSYGRSLFTREVNAAAAGVVAAGADKIFLCDAHDSGHNSDETILSPSVTLLPPHSCNSNLHGLELVKEIYKEKDIGAVVLLGYHAMAGVMEGFLSHSVDANRNKRIKINGREVGEIALIAGIAGYFGIPTVALSGDVAATKEALSFLSEIEIAPTKEKLSDGRVALLDLAEAEALIFNAAKTGFMSRHRHVPLSFGEDNRFEYELASEKLLQNVSIPVGVHREGAVLSWRHCNFIAAWDTFWTIYIATMGGKN
jgi:D-amino peptidase